MCSLLASGADQLLQHGQETLDNLAEIKPFLLERWKKWQANNPSSDQIQYAPAPVSHLPAQELVARSSIQSHGVNVPPSSTPTRAYDFFFSGIEKWRSYTF